MKSRRKRITRTDQITSLTRMNYVNASTAAIVRYRTMLETEQEVAELAAEDFSRQLAAARRTMADTTAAIAALNVLIAER